MKLRAYGEFQSELGGDFAPDCPGNLLGEHRNHLPHSDTERTVSEPRLNKSERIRLPMSSEIGRVIVFRRFAGTLTLFWGMSKITSIRTTRLRIYFFTNFLRI